MNKREARSCFGCKGRLPRAQGSCAFGFGVEFTKSGDGDDQRITRKPMEPCYKPQTNKLMRELEES